jgi:peptidoglycan/LPS O-acetylase OafA/YrhL
LLDFFSIWPFFVEIGLLLVLVATPAFRAADSPPIPAANRIETLDGLRGFLALSVFFHHTAVYHDYLRSGAWNSPSSPFYLHVGPAGVAMFFMITGFLFYSQLLNARGKPNWKKLYVGRAFRILPLYWFAVVLIFAGVMIHCEGRFVEPRLRLFLEFVRWSMGPLFPEAPVNGNDFVYRITLYVTWTLRVEWFFYFSLLLLAISTRWRWSGFLLPPVLLGLSFVHEIVARITPTSWICIALFAIGMGVAALRSARPNLRVRRPIASLLAIACWIGAMVVARDVIFRPIPVLLLGGAFLLVALGANLFGLLESGPARRLGNISFGIYLLQGAVFAGISSFARIRDLDLRSPLGHWTVSLIEAIALVVLATCTHAFIERPGIDLGRRLVADHAREPHLAA